MLLRQIFEAIARTGQGDTAVIGWGRGMGHKGHMMLASSVITKAKAVGGDPYFVVSRTVGKDDPITPDEKLAIYKKVFPQQGHIFQAASDEIPDLTKVLSNLNQQGYKNAVVVVGSDQVAAFQYLKKYNGQPNKAGDIPFNFDKLEVISRQETGDPSASDEGPRATPMRQVLMNPSKSEEEQFAVWRRDMPDNLSDEEVMDLMLKAKQRMSAMTTKKAKEGFKGAALGGLAGAAVTKSMAGARTGAALGSAVQDYFGKEKEVKEKMLPKSAFAGSDKNKLGPAAHLKGKMKRPARQGDLVGGGAQEGVDEGWKSKLAGLGLAATAAMAPGKSDARVNIDDPNSYRAPAPIVQQQKIDYTKPGPVTKDSLGQKLEYGVPVNDKGDFISPSENLPDNEYSSQLTAYKKWKADFLNRWPDATFNPDGSVKSKMKPGLAPYTPGWKPGSGQGLAPVVPGAVKEHKLVPLSEAYENIMSNLIERIIKNDTRRS